jgi:hypothetical protein
LDFTKSHHFVVGYDLQPIQRLALEKRKCITNHLYNVPVNTFSSSYSMLNTGASFKIDLEDSLVNSGTGTNYGAELTIEKVFQPRILWSYSPLPYTVQNTKEAMVVERNTAFNGKYVFNILGGKEWNVGSEMRNNISSRPIKYTICRR